MATETPDPKTFKSWEDEFKYPIPTVRRFEQDLRHNADENRDQLRNLVGASYRELLGTAEQIISMDETMTRVERTLGQVGQKCNSTAVERLFKSYERLEMEYRAQEKEEYSFAAQVSILQACPAVISRLLKSRSYLLAAKIIVLSRLLHKALSTDANATPFLDKLLRRLTSRRRKLLNAIKATFADDAIETHDLVDAMCAYSLATSSTTTDTLKYFHTVRRDTIQSILKRSVMDEGVSAATSHLDAPFQALQIYVSTLTQTIRIFPSGLTAALRKLKSQPLLSDPLVRSIPELDLDSRNEWVIPEVRAFKPWPRTTELGDAECQTILQVWASSTLDILLAGLRNNLTRQEHLEGLISIRRSLLEAWMRASNHVLFRRSRGKQPPISRKEVLVRLRQLLVEVIVAKIRIHTSSLSRIVATIKKGLSSDEELAEIAPSLWSSDATDIPLRDGGRQFKSVVVDRYHGRTEAVMTVADLFGSWSGEIERAQVALRAMRDLRWDDEFDDLDDELMDDDEEEEEVDDAVAHRSRIQTALGVEDPDLLDKALNEGLQATMRSMHEEFERILERLQSIPNSEHGAKLRRTVYLLRCLREIRSALPALFAPAEGKQRRQSVDSQLFALTSESALLSASLHRVLAELVAGRPAVTFGKALHRFAHSTQALALVQLWEGEPKFPTTPTPLAIRLLKSLAAELSIQGPDLWGQAAKSALKNWVAEEIGKSIQDSVEVLKHQPADTIASDQFVAEEDNVGDNADNAQSEELKKQRLVALLYDAAYLSCALRQGQGHGSNDQDFPFMNAVQDASGLEKASIEKISKSAADYWKRTYLLFGTLA
ncbi:hypothetical protein P152DRAFT_106079 [Eremomyces bilateralis CBS 781.70]|uniref:Conserved oligomeric Golgi complex subunit 1 n=1 Tax=Eremomyces bilateralis CBS 781.70 TaxID=1392243 RepID=A0A6G1FX30_9PEZI|nr:uncharacterized protein P152DRAFT_106079 [Eremomyces bilateralis CBS 781.70]KAF1810262.1 hypothetical protein P152DRAFT_106079 [Eremomyces bilateralis CBS 781.70]